MNETVLIHMTNCYLCCYYYYTIFIAIEFIYNIKRRLLLTPVTRPGKHTV